MWVPAVRTVRDLQGPDQSQVAIWQDALPGLPGAEALERLGLHLELVSQRLAGAVRMSEGHHHDLLLVRVRPLKRLCDLDPPALADFRGTRRAPRFATDHQPAIERRPMLLGAVDVHLPVERRVQALSSLVVVASVLEAQGLAPGQQQLPRIALELVPISPRLRPFGGCQQGGGRGFGVGTKGAAFGLAGGRFHQGA